MAQHDYVIANQGFPAFRSDLNDALAAIVSNNSGATEPTTMFAHQMWVDTAANPSVLKIRNADNDAWITIGSIDQTGDTFTLVNLRTSGPVVFNDAGADVDFRVEGDTNANLLFVDAGNNRVGIGTGTPAATLDVNGVLDANGIIIGTNGDSIQTSGGNFFFQTTSAHDLIFRTNSTEGMRIDSSGNVGISVTPSAWSGGFKSLDVLTGGASFSSIGTADARVNANSYFNGSSWIYKASSFATMYQQGSGTHRFFIAPSGTAGNAITFTQAMTLDASGNLLVGKTAFGNTVGFQASGSTGRIFSTLGTNNGTDTLTVYSTAAAANRFYVLDTGTVYATNTTISAISDQRYKENIRDLDVGLAEIMQLQPRVFDWKEGKGKDIQNDRGFIAQEFEQVFPNLVDEWKDPAPEGEEPYKSVRQDLIPVLVKAIQELKAELDTVKAELATLKG